MSPCYAGSLKEAHMRNCVTLAELAKVLDELEPGQEASIHHDLFAELFPPGGSDGRAQDGCLKFAREHLCRLNNKPGPLSKDITIRFVKYAQSP